MSHLFSAPSGAVLPAPLAGWTDRANVFATNSPHQRPSRQTCALSSPALPCLVLLAGCLVARPPARPTYIIARPVCLFSCLLRYPCDEPCATPSYVCEAARCSACTHNSLGERGAEKEGQGTATPWRWAACSVTNCPPPKPYRRWLVIAATVTLPATQGSGEATELGPTWCDSPNPPPAPPPGWSAHPSSSRAKQRKQKARSSRNVLGFSRL
jgi:hypothetical protein